MTRKTQAQFEKEVSIHNKVSVLGTYIDSKTKVTVKCKRCGYIWNANPSKLICGQGCPRCAGNTKKTNTMFVEQCKRVLPSVTLLSEYKNSKSKIHCICNDCGYEWDALPNNLLGGHGCSRCAGNIKKSHYQFIREIKSIHPSISIMSNYSTAKEPVKCRCNTCGYEWEATPNNLLRGHGCQKCSNVANGLANAKSEEKFLNELKLVNPYIEPCEPYSRSNRKISVKCSICGNTWNTLASSLLKGHGCPRCAKTGTSFMEQFILESLRYSIGELSVLSRDKEVIGQELDIYIPSFQLAVEPGSWIYHRHKQERDSEKRNRCIEKSICLVIIYDSYDKEKIPFDRDCLVFPFDLGAEPSHTTLKTIVIPFLLNKIGIEKKFSDADWAIIEKKAVRYSMSISNDDFLERLKAINANIQLIGEYKGADQKIDCSCTICGYKWAPFASSLLKGHGCPRCSGKKKYTQEEFCRKVALVNPDIEILEKYHNTKSHIRCRCKICGNIWSPQAGSILSGKKCPKCVGGVKYTKEEFCKKLLLVNPNIEVL